MDEDEDVVLSDSEVDEDAIVSPQRNSADRAAHRSSSHSAPTTRPGQDSTPATANKQTRDSPTIGATLKLDLELSPQPAGVLGSTKANKNKRASVSPDEKRAKLPRNRRSSPKPIAGGGESSEDDLDMLGSGRRAQVSSSLHAPPPAAVAPDAVLSSLEPARAQDRPYRLPKKAQQALRESKLQSALIAFENKSASPSIDPAPAVPDEGPPSPPKRMRGKPSPAALKKKARKSVVESTEDEEQVQAQLVQKQPPAPAVAPPSSALSDALSDDDDDDDEVVPAAKTPVAIKPSDPTTKRQTVGSSTERRRSTIVIEIPPQPNTKKAQLQPITLDSSPVTAPTAKGRKGKAAPAAVNGKGKGKVAKRTAAIIDSEEDEDEEGGAFDSDAESAILTQPSTEEEEPQPVEAPPAKRGAKQSPTANRKPIAAIGTPTNARSGAMQRRMSAAEREAAVLRAAEEEVEDSLNAPVALAPTGKSRAVLDDEEDEDEDAEKEAKEDSDDGSSDKENAAPAKAPNGALGTPVHAGFHRLNHLINGNARSATPGSARSNGTPGPSSARGVGRILAKLSTPGLRPPGLSSRAHVPRLHANLVSVKARPSVPKEKEKPKKVKGYVDSDEDVPWYESKPVEEWDDDDRWKWAQVQKRKERGWSSD